VGRRGTSFLVPERWMCKYYTFFERIKQLVKSKFHLSFTYHSLMYTASMLSHHCHTGHPAPIACVQESVLHGQDSLYAPCARPHSTYQQQKPEAVTEISGILCSQDDLISHHTLQPLQNHSTRCNTRPS
jgi:hypothetical protein